MTARPLRAAAALLLVAFAGLLTTLAAAKPVTVLHLNSQRYEFVGQGRTWIYQPQTATFQSYLFPATNGGYANAVEIFVRGEDADWFTTFSAPGKVRLTPGRFENAHRWPFEKPTQPGMSIDGDGRGCNVLRGWFVVHEIVYGPGDTIESFAADFEQHCEFNTQVLWGGVRYNSSVPWVDFEPSPPPRWSLQLFGERGNYIGGMTTLSVTQADGDMVARKEYFDNGLRFAYSSSLAAFWSNFIGANGALPTPGTYELAQRYPFQAAGHPGLSITLDSAACNTVTGRFVVHESELDEDNMVSKFAADFEQHCEGGEPALFGGIRFQSDVPQITDPRRPLATRLVYVNGQDRYRVPAGGSLAGMQLMAVNDAGAPIADAGVTVTACNGTFEGQSGRSTYVKSDTSGMVTIPRWFAPSFSFTCRITAELAFYTSASIDLLVDVTGAASGLAYVDEPHIYTGRVGEPLAGLRFAVVDVVGERIAGQLVHVYSGCGNFAGTNSPYFDGTSDVAGIIALPAVTPTTGGQCWLSANFDTNRGPQLYFAVNVLAAGAPLPGPTFIHINSQDGDAIGQGQTVHFTGAQGTFSAARLPGPVKDHVEIFFHTPSNSDTWGFNFAAPEGQALSVGRYEWAREYSYAGRPGIGVGGNARGCNTARGWFQVYELVTDAGGNIVSFAADFEQHCELSPYALYGGIRINSSVPYSDFSPTPFATGSIAVFTDPYDPVGHGRSASFTNEFGEMRGERRSDGVMMLLVTRPPRSGSFVGEFFGPNGAPLVPGAYESSQWPAAAGHPAMRVGMESGCGAATGRFVVHEVDIDIDGIVTRFSADFEQHCDGAAWGSYGSVRYNSAIAPITDPRAPFATHLEFVGGQHAFMVDPGGTLSGLQVATVDGAGSRIANQRVRLNAACAPFDGQVVFPMEVTSNSAGLVDVPRWTAPVGGYRCPIVLELDWNSDQLVFDVYVMGMTASVQLVGPADTRTTWINGVIDGFSAVTLDASGAPLGNQPVQASATCGSFGGASSVSLQSNSSGVVTVPAWTAPAQPTLCQLIVTSSTAPYASTGLSVAVTPPEIAPGTPPIGVRSVSGPSPSGGTIRLSLASAAQSCTLASSAFTDPAFIGMPPLPAGWAYQYALIEFRADNCGVGGTVTFTLNLPQPAREGAQWWSFGPTSDNLAPHWHNLGASVSGSKVSFVITDGMRGDDDVAPNGSLRVRGMVLFPVPISSSNSAPGPASQGTSTPITTRTGTSPAGGGVTMSLAQGGGTCSLADLMVLNPAATDLYNLPPRALAYPRHGYVALRAEGCAAGSDATFTVEFPATLASTAQWWKLGPTPEDRSYHWYAIPSTVEGNRITFTIADGGRGDDDLAANGSIAAFGMVGVPGGDAQDLWWAGPAENGWGMSIVEHGDALFANVFVYDAQGKPTWYVMPSGRWNADHTAFTGDLHLPRSSPFFAYDASRFDIGASVGTATLTFADPNQATFAYTIEGVSGQKSISRVPFGSLAAPLDQPLADLWWAGIAQNGWGIALMQQYSSLFAIWFTYDASGHPTWFAMPNVEFVTRGVYGGAIYRPEGPAWLGVPYDASRHRTVEVGTFTLRFDGAGATFDYSLEGSSRSETLTRVPF